MTILFQDGFAHYPSIASFSKEEGGYYINNLPNVLSYTGAHLGGAEIKRTGSTSSQIMSAELDEDTDIAVLSFIVRASETTATRNKLMIGLNPRSWPLQRHRNPVAPLIAFNAELTGGARMRFNHTVPTAAAPSDAQNMLMIGDMPSPAVGQSYHVEMLVDVRQPLAVMRVHVNGVEWLNTTFNRDRVTNGFQPTSMGSVSIISNDHSFGAFVSDVIVYKPDADHVFPHNEPLKVRYYAPSATLATPADDSTFVEVDTDTDVSYPMPSGSVPSNANVLGAIALVRMRAQNGVSYANADVRLRMGVDDVQVVQQRIPSGFASRLFSTRLTRAQSSPAAINAAAFRMRSPE